MNTPPATPALRSRPHRAGAAVLAALLLLGAPRVVAAAAETDWGAYDGWEIASFTVTGTPPELVDGLAGGLALNGQWKLLRGRVRPDFSARTLARDLARIRLYLAARGYPAADPVPTATPDPRGRRLQLRIEVNPGRPVRYGAIVYEGLPEPVAPPDSARAGTPRVGGIVTDAGVAAAVTALRSHLREEGYAQATAARRVRPLGPGRVALDLIATPGDSYRFEAVEVVGCSADLVPLARRVLDIAPGDPFVESEVQQAALDLRLTRLFRQVELETAESAPGKLTLTAHLENARPRSWDAALGTWTDNPWMIKSDWTDRNAFGGGRGYFVRGVYATHEWRIGGGVFRLGWLSPRALTQLSADRIRIEEDAYTSREYRLALVQSFRPRGRDVLNVGTALSETRIFENVAGAADRPEAQGRLWELWLDRKWDRVDDPLAPSRGGWVKVGLTLSEPWLLSEVPYAALQFDAARYVGLGGGLVGSARVRLGASRSLKSDRDVIANRRFQAGGYSTHRGYRRHTLGPRDDAGNPRGGEAVALLGGEVRIPVVGRLEAAVFLDGGNVWAEAEDVDLGDFPLAAGLALAVRTPIGPLRVGWATNFADRVADEPRHLWHFGIGYPW